ncbi:MAG: hypothetical protein ACKV0T_19790 [Planctomycetales bacterium]
MHRRITTKRSRRRGLAPLELVLSLPFLMIMLAVIINFGIEVKWKLRGLTVSRQAVWRQRGGRSGASEPRPPAWPAEATLSVTPAGPPDLFPNDPFAQYAVIRGPVLSDPQSQQPGSQLLVDTDLFDISGDLETGRAKIDRKLPLLANRFGVHFDLEHLLLESRWRFQDTRLGANVSRRTPTLYQLPPTDEVQAKAERYRQAALAIMNSGQRPSFLSLDRDEEFYMAGRAPPDFHPILQVGCSDNAFQIHEGPVRLLIDRVQGPRGGGRGGVPQAMAEAFRALYQSLLNQPGGPPPGFGDLQGKIDQLNQFLATLR